MQQLPCGTPAALPTAPVLGDTAASRTGVDVGPSSPWVPPLRCGGGCPPMAQWWRRRWPRRFREVKGGLPCCLREAWSGGRAQRAGCLLAGSGHGTGRPEGPRLESRPVSARGPVSCGLCFVKFAFFSFSFQKWLRDRSAVSLSRRLFQLPTARGSLPGNCHPRRGLGVVGPLSPGSGTPGVGAPRAGQTSPHSGCPPRVTQSSSFVQRRFAFSDWFLSSKG